MPRFNGMGPCGMGPRTGKGMGPCGRGYGGRAGYGRRYGAGYGRGYYPFSLEEEKAFLEEEKAYLESRIKELGQILEESDEE